MSLQNTTTQAFSDDFSGGIVSGEGPNGQKVTYQQLSNGECIKWEISKKKVSVIEHFKPRAEKLENIYNETLDRKNGREISYKQTEITDYFQSNVLLSEEKEGEESKN